MKDSAVYRNNFHSYCKKIIFCAGFFAKKSNEYYIS